MSQVPASSPSTVIAASAIITDSVPPGDLSANTDLTAALSTLKASEALVYYDTGADAQARDAYYANLPANLTPAKRFQRLHNLLRGTHTTQLPYKPAVHVYPWVDLHPSRSLRSIYSGHDLDPEELIREDLRIEQERADRLRELLKNEAFITPDRFTEEISLLEDAIPFNCEHIVPQSWFDKRQPMKGDLHHLFACESGCNSFRQNIPYFDFADFDEAVRSDCGKREQNKFEPGAGKGTVARATFYFLLRYPGEINRNSTEYTADRLEILLKWHTENPVEQYEQHRNAAIQKKQGNRNPLIDFPELAEEIDFSRGLG
jgi:endonuclease I